MKCISDIYNQSEISSTLDITYITFKFKITENHGKLFIKYKIKGNLR